MKKLLRFLCVAIVSAGCSGGNSFTFPEDGIEIAEVVSDFNVGFKMMEKEGKLYMTYYDTLRRMTLATFDPETGETAVQPLPSEVNWDGHDYTTFAFDRKGFLHVSGNMHAQPLVYFRSTEPYDIHSLVRVESMTGCEETFVTYPVFMDAPDGRLIFHYRTGGSGNGSEIYNVYDESSKEWKRMLDKPLTDGQGLMNAYMQGPTPGKDGYYHLIWVWRDTPDCSTNHTLSYARSRDLVHWENAAGTPTDLPITFDKEDFYVDPTPAKGGLFNPAITLGFDSKGAPVIGYYKYDDDGNNQLYAARFEDGAWMIRQLTHWDYRWQFEGNGSIRSQISIQPPVSDGKGLMSFAYNHVKEGKGAVLFDENTLEAVGTRPAESPYPERYNTVRSSFPGMIPHVLLCGDYLLHWETLPTNRDMKPEGELPRPVPLTLYKWK